MGKKIMIFNRYLTAVFGHFFVEIRAVTSHVMHQTSHSTIVLKVNGPQALKSNVLVWNLEKVYWDYDSEILFKEILWLNNSYFNQNRPANILSNTNVTAILWLMLLPLGIVDLLYVRTRVDEESCQKYVEKVILS